jgi:hypothetical protein
MSRHQGKEEAPEDGGHRGFLVPWGNNDGEGKSHQVYHLIIADRLINPGQVSRVVGSVSGNVGFWSIADLSSAHPTVC